MKKAVSTPTFIMHAAIPVLRHRRYTNLAADSEGLTSVDLGKKLIASRRDERIAALLSSLSGLDKQGFRFTQR